MIIFFEFILTTNNLFKKWTKNTQNIIAPQVLKAYFTH